MTCLEQIEISEHESCCLGQQAGWPETVAPLKATRGRLSRASGAAVGAFRQLAGTVR